MLKAVLKCPRTICLVNPEIEVSGANASSKLCREIVNRFPELANMPLEVYRGDNLAYTINKIKNWAKYDLEERENGIVKVRNRK